MQSTRKPNRRVRATPIRASGIGARRTPGYTFRSLARAAPPGAGFPETHPTLIPAPSHAARSRTVPGPRHARALAGATLMVLAAVAGAIAPARAEEPDYSGYQNLLRRYVQVLRAPGKPWDSRFDYEQLYIDENIWTLRRADGLNRIHNQLLAVTPSELTPRERSAWAINTYNFLAIERMTLNLLVPGRRFMRYDSPREMYRDEGPFFAAPVATVEGREYSLTGFERRFVYGDTTAQPLADGTTVRETGGDPRLQLALVKASLCSGPILPWVYRADSLEAQLDRAARLALALPRWLRYDAATGLLSASNRFFEERADLGGPELPGLMPLLARHAPAEVKKGIQLKKLTRPGIFFEPDWKLNQFDHPKPKLPGAARDSVKHG